MEARKCLGQPIIEEEIQGLYGSIKISEATLQKIWLNKDFLHNHLKTHNGKDLRILNSGKWNRFEGPDFTEAELLIDGKKLLGDVEIHFHPIDWLSHGHHFDTHFKNVILHVTLFEPSISPPQAHTEHGFCPETLVLLPYLRQSLEEYATEEALLHFEARDNAEYIQAFMKKPVDEVLILLKEKALKRWKQKQAFSKYRLSKESWREVCHQMLLEGLGYRRNRAAMSDIAHQYPLDHLLQNLPSVDTLYNEGSWKLAKIRPANHPRKRLQQYLELIQEGKDWTEQWAKLATKLPYKELSIDTASYRKAVNLSHQETTIKEQVFLGKISGSRFHTLIIDALLPLASAYLGRDFFELWYHWYEGDMPIIVNALLKSSQLTQNKVTHCNGLNQGILHLLLESSLIRTN